MQQTYIPESILFWGVPVWPPPPPLHLQPCPRLVILVLLALIGLDRCSVVFFVIFFVALKFGDEFLSGVGFFFLIKTFLGCQKKSSFFPALAPALAVVAWQTRQSPLPKILRLIPVLCQLCVQFGTRNPDFLSEKYLVLF